MNPYMKVIPLEVEIIIKIVNSIEAADYVCREELASYNCPTDNGIDGMYWNFRNREIERVLKGDRFHINVMRRGIWKLIGIYDKQTKFFYTLMRCKNFYNLRKNASKKLMHYLNALGRLNKNLLDKYDLLGEQLVLGEEFALDKTYYEKLDDILASLLKDVDGDIETYALISFEMQYGQISQLEGIIPSVGMNYFARENWIDCIGTTSVNSVVAGNAEKECVSQNADNGANDKGEPLLRRKSKTKVIAE
ncbi:MAG: hypothetical protein IJ963_06325 [Phascolarctobacterium sp.]|nr:hypothetical protein [Phascolarctobacterium sp.]MBR2507282.1 hypothetical protein [Bacilli bacterium]